MGYETEKNTDRDVASIARASEAVRDAREAFELLLVEDDEDHREMVRGWLLRSFPRVVITVAESLEQARRALDARQFDVVLTDLGLPDSPHEETLPQLHAQAHAPIIALTGHGEEGTAMRAMRVGAEDYLIKGSVNAELLRRAVMQARERHLLHRRMAELATFDSLTGLWNREPFTQEVKRAWERATRYDDEFALLFIDLDHFKEVNDRHGHEAGDRLLQAVAQRLTACVRRTDFVGRLGGDEFAVLLDRISEGDLEDILGRMHESIREPADLGEVTVSVSASIGVARSSAHGQSPSELFRHADAAMYQAKTQGRNRFRRFDSTLHKQLRDEREALRCLRQAVVNHEFELHYQPIFDAGSKSTHSFEALVRWRHRTRGLLSPDHFIADLEKDDTVIDFGRQVMTDVCCTLAARRKEGRPLSISVNVSPREFEVPYFARHVEEALQAASAAAQDLKLEITERMLIGDVARARATLGELAELGVQVAIDDFGTGYSSLAYLRSLPVSALKIDRVFISGAVDGATDAAIIEAVARLAHGLGYVVVAEGVENARQLDEVRRLGCDAWQGFYGARPMPLDDLLDWVERGRL